jgi:hypothetical protein
VILLEIAAQGVRGVSPPGGRAGLRPGYNVLGVDGASLRRLLEALFYPDAQQGLAELRGSEGAPARAGVTLAGDDGGTYRLVRELGGACQLQRFDPERRTFAPVSSDPAEIGRLLQEKAGVPRRPRLGALLALSAAELPSRRGGVPALPGSAAAFPAERAVPPAEVEKRLAALHAELERARAAEKLQYQLDGLQSRLFKLEEDLKAGEKHRADLADAESAVAQLSAEAAAIDRLGDWQGRLAAAEKAASSRDETLARIGAEREALDEAAAGAAPSPFWTDPRFLAGGGVGLLAALAAAAGSGGGAPGFRYLALLDPFAFGYAGWIALGWVGRLEASEKAGQRRKVIEDRERKAREEFDRGHAEVRAAMKAIGVGTLGDLREAAGRLAEARAAVEEARRRLTEWEAEPAASGARAEKEKVQSESAALEARLAEVAGGFVRDPRSVESDIARLEAGRSAPEPAGTALPPLGLGAPAPGAPAGDALRQALDRAAAELGRSPAETLRALQGRLAEVLPAFTTGRFAGCLLDERGNVLAQGGGKTTPVSMLPPADRDACWLAVRLGLAEQGVAGSRTVVLADDLFANLPEAARRLVARLLQQLARAGQVLHATADPVFREAADHAA